VQLDALRFLASCNQYSNTPASVAEYLDTTRGTVSQTLIALERKGLIAKHTDPDDGRVVHCVPTAAGLDVVVQSAKEDQFSAAVEGLGADEQEQLASLLAQVTSQVSNAREVTAFGRCTSCAHLRGSGRMTCAYTADDLDPSHMARLCRYHLRAQRTPSLAAVNK
jgi:DNA-binding MarR family transcriptional regulator